MRIDRRGRLGAGAACCVLLALLTIVGAPAQGRNKRVLLLYDEDRTLPGLAVLDQSIRSTFGATVGTDIEFFTESLNVSRFNTERDEQVLRAYYSEKYRDRRPDLVMAVMGPTLAFLRRHGDEIFPAVPIVFCGADAADIAGTTLPAHVTGILVQRVFAPNVDVVLRLQPETRRIVVVGGTSTFDRHLMAQAQRQFQPFEQRVAFDYLTELSLPDLVAAVSRLPPDSVVMFVTFFRDVSGRTFIPHDVVAQLSGAASVPVYVFVDQYLGRGAVGGHLYSLEQHGTSAAELGLRVLRGERPSDIPVRELPSTANIFDARQLRRWNLAEARLPAGSEVRFRGPSLWRDYRREVLGVLAALSVQALLIVGLLYQRRARRRAEVDSRQSLSLAADATRRVTMSALTGSIAHELSQPLNAILHNVQAGEMLVAANRATPDVLRDILADIRMADVRATEIIERHRLMLKSRQHESQPIDLHGVIRESVNLVAGDARKRQIPVDVNLASNGCVVAGDQVLLQQVIVNLLVNAMDAMADTPVPQRRINVQCAAADGVVTLSVQDAGTGLPTPLDGNLFKPFVTTKANGMGIGLTIARTIVEAHGGRIEARNNPAAGATFAVTLPTSR